MKKSKKQIRDQQDLFVGLIRRKGLYQLLERLAASCRSEANHSREMFARNSDGVLSVMYENEVSFFEDAALNVEFIVGNLRTTWQGREPMQADGNMLRAMKELGGNYLHGLLNRLLDPNASEEDKKEAVAELGNQSAIWIDNETGKPSQEMADWFRTAVGMLASPETSEAEKARITLTLKAMTTGNK